MFTRILRRLTLALIASLGLIGQSFAAEAILDYQVHVVVNTDNSIAVAERIQYDSGGRARHGILRDIYPYSSAKKRMAIENITVTDEAGKPLPFQSETKDGQFRIRIGSRDQTFLGTKIFIIKYVASRAVAQFKDFDEIYWNVTGNEWSMPIERAEAFLQLPGKHKHLQAACYYGPKGSKTQCAAPVAQDGWYRFAAPEGLGIGSGLTVALGFSKGLVQPYHTSFWEQYKSWILAILLPAFSLFGALLYWRSYGRDERATRLIIPQYEVFADLTPIETAGIIYEQVDSEAISAEIIYLASKGYLKIREIKETTLGIFTSTDFELERVKDYSQLPNDYDRRLLAAFFRHTGLHQQIRLSALNDRFYKDKPAIINATIDALNRKEYYKNTAGMKNRISLWLLLFCSVWIAAVTGGLLASALTVDNPFPPMLGMFFAILIIGLAWRYSPAKTAKGVSAKEHMLGLREYLQVAEKDRLEFHNAPEKKPELFERLLPYAMVLGVAKIWAKEFEGIYKAEPAWYSSADGSFSSLSMQSALSKFSSQAASVMSSSPSSSGSSGGGSSGGGGGGGGGSSW